MITFIKPKAIKSVLKDLGANTNVFIYTKSFKPLGFNTAKEWLNTESIVDKKVDTLGIKETESGELIGTIFLA